MDEALRRYRQLLEEKYRDESRFTESQAEAHITYAGKAFLCSAMAQWANQNGLWIDCTGAGEIQIAVNARVHRERILVHGVNKSPADLEAAINHAGVIVVDNLAELERTREFYSADTKGINGGKDLPALWLRLRPGLTVETHAYTQTGHQDSKFGMGLEEANAAVIYCLERNLPLKGIHFHLGSQFRDPAPIGTPPSRSSRPGA